MPDAPAFRSPATTLPTAMADPLVQQRAVGLLEQLLDEIEVAGGEVVITSTPGGSPAWSVQALTDLDRAHRLRYAGAGSGAHLLAALTAANAALLDDQRHGQS